MVIGRNSLDTEDIELLHKLYIQQINQTSIRLSDSENRIFKVLRDNYAISINAINIPEITSAGIVILAKAGKTTVVFDIIEEILYNLQAVDRLKELNGDEVESLISNEYNETERHIAFQFAFEQKLFSGIFFIGSNISPWSLNIEKKADIYIETPSKIHDFYRDDEKMTKIDEELIFVIMAFSSDMDPIYEGMKNTSDEFGLKARKVDDDDLIGDYRITDKIIELIEKSKFVIADLTHEKPNVYFELGYARGIGKTVITTARKGTTLHFDVKDWTCIFYNDSKTLEKELRKRIKAEIKNEKKNQVIPQISETLVGNIPNLSIIEAEIDDYYRIDGDRKYHRPGNKHQEFEGIVSLLLRFHNTIDEGDHTSFNINDAKIIHYGTALPFKEIIGGRNEFPVARNYMQIRFDFSIPEGYEFIFEGELEISGTYFVEGKKRLLDQTIPLEITDKKKSELDPPTY